MAISDAVPRLGVPGQPFVISFDTPHPTAMSLIMPIAGFGPERITVEGLDVLQNQSINIEKIDVFQNRKT
ncbi:MAG: hypothetical protein ABIW76_16920 [Fibrobacteria bacterium]